MPNVVNYPTVLERMTALGFRSLYFNSGAFGFGAGAATISRGWIGPPDDSIREQARPMVRQAVAPFDVRLTAGLTEIWRQALPGPVWAMPKSHWAYELQFGHGDWLPGLLNEIGVDAAQLSLLNNAAAIEFRLTNQTAFALFVRQLLNRLISSDFQLVFPGHSTLCTIHTRCQLWWTTIEESVVERLDAVMGADGNANS